MATYFLTGTYGADAIKGSVSISKMTGISFTTNPAITAEEFDEYMT